MDVRKSWKQTISLSKGMMCFWCESLYESMNLYVSLWIYMCTHFWNSWFQYIPPNILGCDFYLWPIGDDKQVKYWYGQQIKVKATFPSLFVIIILIIMVIYLALYKTDVTKWNKRNKTNKMYPTNSSQQQHLLPMFSSRSDVLNRWHVTHSTK